PRLARVSKTTSHTASLLQRMKRTKTEFQLPYRSGMSRQGAPVGCAAREKGWSRRMTPVPTGGAAKLSFTKLSCNGSGAMPAYSHLLDEERDQIAVMSAAGRSICALAGALQRAKSTVSRGLPQRLAQRALFAASRRRSLSAAQAACVKPYSRKIRR